MRGLLKSKYFLGIVLACLFVTALTLVFLISSEDKSSNAKEPQETLLSEDKKLLNNIDSGDTTDKKEEGAKEEKHTQIIDYENTLLSDFAAKYIEKAKNEPRVEEDTIAGTDAENGNTVCADDIEAGEGTEAEDDTGTEEGMEAEEEDEIDFSNVVFLNIYMQGTRDTSVAAIQQKLMDLGFMDVSEPTQYYGSITAEAVKRFQRQNDLKQDGIMGEKSLEMLMNPEAKRYLLKKGMSGSDIKDFQTRLYELGYLETKNYIDGNFGEETESAVKHLQQANGLSPDGMIGEMTIELVYSGDVKANILSFGDKSQIVRECQERLKELGYLTTKPDGNYGNDTQAAVKLFQQKNGIIVDGYLGPSTREVLESSSAIPNGLTIGDEGDTVKRVQQLLIKYGYMKTGSDTGYFGEVTESAVKKFQSTNGLLADGNVGRKTMLALTGDSVVKAGEKKTDSGKDTGSGKSDNGGDNSGSGNASVTELIRVAKTKIGCKYHLGDKGPNTFDCSGFVYWCLNQIGYKQSYITSKGWRTYGKGKKITSLKDVKAGDIIVCDGHVGIAAGDNMVIDASSSQGKIVYRKMSSWWDRKFICAWRIF